MTSFNQKALELTEYEITSGITNSKYLNLPDLEFSLWCQRKYKVTKGIYNELDCWFYEYDIVNVHHRRIYILAFLEFIKEQSNDKKKYFQFGAGGLNGKLHQFIRRDTVFFSNRGKSANLNNQTAYCKNNLNLYSTWYSWGGIGRSQEIY